MMVMAWLMLLLRKPSFEKNCANDNLENKILEEGRQQEQQVGVEQDEGEILIEQKERCGTLNQRRWETIVDDFR